MFALCLLLLVFGPVLIIGLLMAFLIPAIIAIELGCVALVLVGGVKVLGLSARKLGQLQRAVRQRTRRTTTREGMGPGLV